MVYQTSIYGGKWDNLLYRWGNSNGKIIEYQANTLFTPQISQILA